MFSITKEQEQLLKQNIQKELLNNILNLSYIPVDVKKVDIFSKDFSVEVLDYDDYYVTDICDRIKFHSEFISSIKYKLFPITKRVNVSLSVDLSTTYKQEYTSYNIYFNFDDEMNIKSYKIVVCRNGVYVGRAVYKEYGKTEDGLDYELYIPTKHQHNNEYNLLRTYYEFYYHEKIDDELFRVRVTLNHNEQKIITKKTEKYKEQGIEYVKTFIYSSQKRDHKDKLNNAKDINDFVGKLDNRSLIEQEEMVITNTEIKGYNTRNHVAKMKLAFVIKKDPLTGESVVTSTKMLTGGHELRDEYITTKDVTLRKVFIDDVLEEEFIYITVPEEYYLFKIFRHTKTIFKNHKANTKRTLLPHVTGTLSHRDSRELTKNNVYRSYTFIPEKHGNIYYITLSGILAMSIRINGL